TPSRRVRASTRSAMRRSRARRGRPSGARAPNRAQLSPADLMRAVRLAVAAALVCALGGSVPFAAPAAVAAPADAVRDAQYWLDDYGIRQAWTVTRGAGVTIAVIDTGVGDPADLRGAV